MSAAGLLKCKEGYHSVTLRNGIFDPAVHEIFEDESSLLIGYWETGNKPVVLCWDYEEKYSPFLGDFLAVEYPGDNILDEEIAAWVINRYENIGAGISEKAKSNEGR